MYACMYMHVRTHPRTCVRVQMFKLRYSVRGDSMLENQELEREAPDPNCSSVMWAFGLGRWGLRVGRNCTSIPLGSLCPR